MPIDCPICFKSIKDNTAAALPCGHLHDRQCAALWPGEIFISCGICHEPCNPEDILPIYYTFYNEKDQALEQELKVTKDKMKQQEEDIHTYKQMIKQYEAAELLLRIDMETLEGRNNDLESKYIDQSDLMKILEANSLKEEQLLNDIQVKEKALVQKNEETDLLKNKNKALILKNKELGKLNFDTEQKIVSLKSENHTLKCSMGELRKKNDVCFRNESNLKELLEKTEKRTRKLEKKEISLTNEYGKLLSKISILKEENANLQEKLDETNDLCCVLGELNVTTEKENEEDKKRQEKIIQIMTKNNAKLFKQKEEYVKDLMILKKKMYDKKPVLGQSPHINKEKFQSVERELGEVKTRRNRLIRESNKFRKKAMTLEKENKGLKRELAVAAALDMY